MKSEVGESSEVKNGNNLGPKLSEASKSAISRAGNRSDMEFRNHLSGFSNSQMGTRTKEERYWISIPDSSSTQSRKLCMDRIATELVTV